MAQLSSKNQPQSQYQSQQQCTIKQPDSVHQQQAAFPIAQDHLGYHQNIYETQYQSIADRMLKQLEDQYWQVQKSNIKKDDCPNQQEEDHENIPEGYQTFGNDGFVDDSDDNSQQAGQEQSKGQSFEEKQQNCENSQISNQLQIQTLNNLEQFQQFQEPSQSQQIKNDVQLIQVGPVPNSTFQVPQTRPQAQTEEISSADCDRIKNFALSLDIQTPDWAKDPKQLEEKIKRLFLNVNVEKDKVKGKQEVV